MHKLLHLSVLTNAYLLLNFPPWQRNPRGSLLRDPRKTRARIFVVSASCHSIRVTKPLRRNSYRNADSRESVGSRNKALLPCADLAEGKSDQRQAQSPRVCSPFWPAIIKSDRMTTQSPSWSEHGKEGGLGGLVLEVHMQWQDVCCHLLGFYPVIIIRTRYIACTQGKLAWSAS